MFQQILDNVKSRLNRSENDHTLDGYLMNRIYAAVDELSGRGIHIRETSGDIMFVTDYVCWQYSNRDKNEDMPEWLKLARRERFLHDGGIADDT